MVGRLVAALLWLSDCLWRAAHAAGGAATVRGAARAAEVGDAQPAPPVDVGVRDRERGPAGNAAAATGSSAIP